METHMMSNLQTSHRGRRMSPLELCPPVTSEFLQLQPDLFYRYQQPLRIPLRKVNICQMFLILQLLHAYVVNLSTIHQNPINVFYVGPL